MKIKFFADLRETIGKKEINLKQKENKTIKEILLEISEDHPSLEKRLFDENNSIRDHIQVLVNGEKASPEKYVNAEDEIAIFPPVSGGVLFKI